MFPKNKDRLLYNHKATINQEINIHRSHSNLTDCPMMSVEIQDLVQNHVTFGCSSLSSGTILQSSVGFSGLDNFEKYRQLTL